VDGKSQVLGLDAADAARLEPVRAEATALLDHLARSGLGRETLAAAVPFTTLAAPSLVLAMRAELYEHAVSTAVTDVVNASPWHRGLWILMPGAATILPGKLTTFDHLDTYTTALRADGSGVPRPIDFVLTIPGSAEVGKPIPVVLFGHGLETSRELIYMIA